MTEQEFGNLCLRVGTEFYDNRDGEGIVAQLDTNKLTIDIYKEDDGYFLLLISDYFTYKDIIDKRYKTMNTMINAVKREMSRYV